LIGLGLEAIDLLKIDIEGGEFEVLPSVRQLGKVQTIFGEAHAYLSDSPVEELLSCLTGFNVQAQSEGRNHFPSRERAR
jgi:hypothetical protein